MLKIYIQNILTLASIVPKIIKLIKYISLFYIFFSLFLRFYNQTTKILTRKICVSEEETEAVNKKKNLMLMFVVAVEKKQTKFVSFCSSPNTASMKEPNIVGDQHKN